MFSKESAQMYIGINMQWPYRQLYNAELWDLVCSQPHIVLEIECKFNLIQIELCTQSNRNLYDNIINRALIVYVRRSSQTVTGTIVIIGARIVVNSIDLSSLSESGQLRISQRMKTASGTWDETINCDANAFYVITTTTHTHARL